MLLTQAFVWGIIFVCKEDEDFDESEGPILLWDCTKVRELYSSIGEMQLFVLMFLNSNYSIP